MSEYTPTPNEARADFITLRTRNFDAYQVGRSLTSEQEFYGAQYDRMIAAIEREAAAKALAEFAVEIERCDMPERGVHINMTQYREGLIDGVSRAMRAASRRAAEIRGWESK